MVLAIKQITTTLSDKYGAACVASEELSSWECNSNVVNKERLRS